MLKGSGTLALQHIEIEVDQVFQSIKMFWNRAPSESRVGWGNNVEPFRELLEERQMVLWTITAVQEQQGWPCPLAHDWQVDVLQCKSTAAFQHAWIILDTNVAVSFCRLYTLAHHTPRQGTKARHRVWDAGAALRSMGRTARMRRPRASLEQEIPAAYNGHMVSLIHVLCLGDIGQ